MRRCRLYLTTHFLTIGFWLSTAMIIFSLFFVFTLPSSLHPRTSVGLMNGLAAILLVLTIIASKDKWGWLRLKKRSQIHLSMLWYLIAVGLSLLFTQTIHDSTPIRLLLSGAVMFFVVQDFHPNEVLKRRFIHVLGGLSLFISIISLMQLAFPDFMNSIANAYFYGRDAYGLSIEFGRGRLLHWGALIFVFPFFYSSSVLLRWKERFWTSTYVVVGYVCIFAAMIMANFRWTFLVFVAITIVHFYYSQRFRFITIRKMVLLCAMLALVIEIGILTSSSVFGYSLIDRFLLKNAQRDITDTSGRILLYDQATTVFLAYPIVGAGYGNYYSVVSPFPLWQLFRKGTILQSMPVPLASHNEFFTVLAETGVLGFVGFLFILYFTLKRAYVLMHHARLSPVNRLFALSIWSSLLSYGLYVLFENMYPQNIIYLLMLSGIVYSWFGTAKQ